MSKHNGARRKDRSQNKRGVEKTRSMMETYMQTECSILVQHDSETCRMKQRERVKVRDRRRDSVRGEELNHCWYNCVWKQQCRPFTKAKIGRQVQIY